MDEAAQEVQTQKTQTQKAWQGERRRLLAAIASLFVGFLVFFAWLISSPARNVRISNITSNSLTLTWNTNKAVRGCVINYKLLVTCDLPGNRLTTHFVIVKGLEPKTKYNFLIQNGLLFKVVGGETSEVSQKTPSAPNPAYGQVALADKITLVPFANVFVTVGGKLLSTFSNTEGGFSLDLGDIRDQRAFLLEVDAGVKGSAKKPFYAGEYQPMGVITINSEY